MKNFTLQKPIGWLLIGLFTFIPFVSCSSKKSAPAKPPSGHPTPLQDDFLVRLYSVQPGNENEFVTLLHDCYMPVWNNLRADGIISSVNVFELQLRASATPETPAWRFLLLFQLDSTAEPGDLPDTEIASNCQHQSDESSFTVLRVERMSCTPNSCYRMPEPTYQDAPTGIEYLIEFIGVENSPQYLKKYRDLMSDYFGPANGILVEEGMQHAFIALETSEVLFQATGVPGWNQLHISDDWNVVDNIDWEAVYSDLFHREFSKELDDVWAELPPIRERPISYRGQLVPDLCVR